MRFGVFDHNDASGRPPATQIAERLELIEAYEGLGYHAYHMAEHHGGTNEAAMAIANRAFVRFRANFEMLWNKFGVPLPRVLSADTFEGIHATGHFYAGDPAGARAWVARHRDVGGINYMALELAFGDMTAAETLRSAELFATEVMPAFTAAA